MMIAHESTCRTRFIKYIKGCKPCLIQHRQLPESVYQQYTLEPGKDSLKRKSHMFPVSEKLFRLTDK